MPILTEYPIDSIADSILDSVKVTSGYFPSGVGQLNAELIYTGSLADSNETFYYNIVDSHTNSSSADVVFSVAYGHNAGSGSKKETGTIGESKAVYGQWAETLLSPNEVSGGFKISTGDGNVTPGNPAVSSGPDDDIFVLVGKRARFKDRINKKNWTIILSGSSSQFGSEGHVESGITSGSAANKLVLTDDSDTVSAVATPAGPRYNIVSGSDGSVVSASSHKTYGWFYPNMGVMVFSQAELSASIPGNSHGTAISASFSDFEATNARATGSTFESSSGFGVNITANTVSDPKNALRFINCLKTPGAYLKFRSEEDQTSVSYFCRVRANEGNFSNNITFVSGSANRLRQKSMWGNPSTYITGIGLMNAQGVMVATAKLSTPLKKNFASEATIKVKLTY